MKYLVFLMNFVMHIDKYLNIIIDKFGVGSYIIIFLLIFCETGLVVTPFLPGDSLLFTLGTFSAAKYLNIGWVVGILMAAAILGDTVNYEIGKLLGEKVLDKKELRFIKREHLEKTQNFYNKYGNKTIIIARFVPIVRTLAPFVAAIGKMKYRQFITYNVIGGVLWVSLFTLAGYFFGNFPLVKNNLAMVMYIIIFVSILPMLYAYINKKIQDRKLPQA